MRRLSRPQLPSGSTKYLARKAANLLPSSDVEKVWKAARRTKAMGAVAQTLDGMSGSRQRCHYCSDSRSTDIEHYWPKAAYRDRVFSWENMLWICTGCNRLKGDRFELDGGVPLLIDPSSDDPWEFLYYDVRTGIIVARFDRVTGVQSSRGVYTTREDVLPLNIQAVTEGRKRTVRNLVRFVSTYLEITAPTPANTDALIAAIADNDDYGLAQWFFRYEGADDLPFKALCQNSTELKGRILRAIESPSPSP